MSPVSQWPAFLPFRCLAAGSTSAGPTTEKLFTLWNNRRVHGIDKSSVKIAPEQDSVSQAFLAMDGQSLVAVASRKLTFRFSTKAAPVRLQPETGDQTVASLLQILFYTCILLLFDDTKVLRDLMDPFVDFLLCRSILVLFVIENRWYWRESLCEASLVHTYIGFVIRYRSNNTLYDYLCQNDKNRIRDSIDSYDPALGRNV